MVQMVFMPTCADHKAHHRFFGETTSEQWEACDDCQCSICSLVAINPSLPKNY